MTSVDSLPGERRWSIYGLVVTTPHPFANRLAPTDAPADLWIRPVAASPLPIGWDEGEPAWSSTTMVDEHRPFLSLHLTPDATVFRFGGVVDFFVLGDGIAYQVLDVDYGYMVELHLLGFVLAYWLERAGWPALHASSVIVDGHAIAFLSIHGGGKTSLAATMLRRGYPLGSDDIVGLAPTSSGFLARPGYPQMRMWPEQAHHFVGHDAWEQVHPGLTKRRVPVGADGIGAFDGALRPLAAMYLPQRRDGGAIEFETLPPAQALFELVRHTFLVGIVEGAGLAGARFTTLAEVIRHVPLRIVRYPNGLERLPTVAERIADDARTLARGV